MYTSFRIQNFRLFEDLTLNDLGRVNLIAGKNNTGKTSLLEALFIHCGVYNPGLTVAVGALRNLPPNKDEPGTSGGTFWDSLFRNFDATGKVLLQGLDHTGERIIEFEIVHDPDELINITQNIQKTSNPANLPITTSVPKILRIEYHNGDDKVGVRHILQTGETFINETPQQPPFQTIFLPAYRRLGAGEADRYGELVRTKRQGVVLEAAKIIEKRIESISVFPVGGVSSLYADIGLPTLLPLMVMGDGVTHIVNMVVGIANAQNGIVLIDEIENGLHYSVLKDVWKAIGKAARDFNVQVFATTHSFECIQAAHEAFKDSEANEFRYHRLQRSKDGKIQAATYEQDTLEAAIEMDLEVR